LKELRKGCYDICRLTVVGKRHSKDIQYNCQSQWNEKTINGLQNINKPH